MEKDKAWGETILLLATLLRWQLDQVIDIGYEVATEDGGNPKIESIFAPIKQSPTPTSAVEACMSALDVADVENIEYNIDGLLTRLKGTIMEALKGDPNGT